MASGYSQSWNIYDLGTTLSTIIYGNFGGMEDAQDGPDEGTGRRWKGQSSLLIFIRGDCMGTQITATLGELGGNSIIVHYTILFSLFARRIPCSPKCYHPLEVVEVIELHYLQKYRTIASLEITGTVSLFTPTHRNRLHRPSSSLLVCAQRLIGDPISSAIY